MIGGGRYSRPPEMEAALEGARREIPKDFLSRRGRGVQVLRTSSKICQQIKVTFFFFFLSDFGPSSPSSRSGWFPKQPLKNVAQGTRGKDMRTGAREAAPARRRCKRREQKAPPSRVKLKSPHPQHLSASTAGLVVPTNQKVLAEITKEGNSSALRGKWKRQWQDLNSRQWM